MRNAKKASKGRDWRTETLKMPIWTTKYIFDVTDRHFFKQNEKFRLHVVRERHHEIDISRLINYNDNLREFTKFCLLS